MSFGTISGNGYLLIAGLVLVGIGFLAISLFVNFRVAHSVREDARHQEKLFEYYRNTFSQLGVILIGIGVSLFIFFFQQNYQDQRKRESDLQQVLAKMAVRIGRTAALVESLSEFDDLLDDGGPYANVEDGGDNHAITARGADLVKQINDIRLVERDVDLEDFGIVRFSADFESSTVVNDLDPQMLFNMAEDESEVRYAVVQLKADYGDLRDVIGGRPLDAVIADPALEQKTKHEVLDVFYDVDILRDRSRRLLGRACWLYSHGLAFVKLKPIAEVEADYRHHREWIDQAKIAYGQSSAGGDNCFKLLHYQLDEKS